MKQTLSPVKTAGDLVRSLNYYPFLLLCFFTVALCTAPVYADEARDVARLKARLSEIFPQDSPRFNPPGARARVV